MNENETDKRVAYELRMMADTFLENYHDLLLDGTQGLAYGYWRARLHCLDRADYLDPDGEEER